MYPLDYISQSMNLVREFAGEAIANIYISIITRFYETCGCKKPAWLTKFKAGDTSQAK
jgi:hypothetical protein